MLAKYVVEYIATIRALADRAGYLSFFSYCHFVARVRFGASGASDNIGWADTPRFPSANTWPP